LILFTSNSPLIGTGKSKSTRLINLPSSKAPALAVSADDFALPEFVAVAVAVAPLDLDRFFKSSMASSFETTDTVSGARSGRVSLFIDSLASSSFAAAVTPVAVSVAAFLVLRDVVSQRARYRILQQPLVGD